MLKTITIKTLLILAFSVGIGTTALAATLEKPTISVPKEGRHYTVLETPGKTRAPHGKVEVIEFFWYGCPHCYRLEPYMEQWEANKADYAHLRRVPVPYNNLWNLHARTYYTAEKLRLVKKVHRPFFDAIHKERKRMTTQQNVADFFAAHGVDSVKFNDTFSSFSVEARMRLATKEANFYKVTGVPSVVINGKYTTSPSMAGSEANLIQIIRYLTKLEKDNEGSDSG